MRQVEDISLGDRREYLNRTEKWIKDNIDPNVVGQYVGGKKPAELEAEKDNAS